jgi:hypothetical protein
MLYYSHLFLSVICRSAQDGEAREHQQSPTLLQIAFERRAEVRGTASAARLIATFSNFPASGA